MIQDSLNKEKIREIKRKGLYKNNEELAEALLEVICKRAPEKDDGKQITIKDADIFMR